MKITRTLLLPAWLAAAALHAQTSTQTAFIFTPQVWPNAVIGGYAFDEGVRIDAIALSDSGALAFTAHRENGGTGRDQTAVCTKERLIAREGQIIDGKQIVRIATAVLAVTNAGRVAYETLYVEPGHRDVHGGIFVEDRFVTEFEPSPTGAATPFVVADDGMVRLRDGIMTQKPKRSFLTNNFYRATHSFERNLLNRIPRGSYPDLWGGGVDLTDTVVWDKITGPPLPKRSQNAPASDARSCPAPAFPMPADWSLGAVGAGPIAAKLFEPGSPMKPYDSPIYGRLASPFRQIQFDRSCAPQVITVGDDKGHLETHTPRGLLTYAKPDGTLELPGFFQRAVAGSFVASDVSFATNVRGQIAIRIAVDGGGAVLLATPVAVKP